MQTCTLRDLVPEGAAAGVEDDPEVARLKSSAALVAAIEPRRPDVRGAADRGHGGRDAVGGRLAQLRTTGPRRSTAPTPEPRTTRRATRCWEELLTILVDKVDDEDVAADLLRRSLRAEPGAGASLQQGMADARPDRRRRGPVVGAGIPARCARRGSSPTRCRRCSGRTRAPGPCRTCRFLDAARQRIGDPEASRRRRRHAATVAAERERMRPTWSTTSSRPTTRRWRHVDAARARTCRASLVDEGALTVADPDRLAGPFAHVVVDEAQELTDAEWQMLLLRCPSRSFTIVGDRAQARHGFTESWSERLARIGLDRVDLAALTINYRTPGGGHGRGRAGDPRRDPGRQRADVGPQHRDARRHGLGGRARRDRRPWLAEHPEGIACVIAVDRRPQ